MNFYADAEAVRFGSAFNLVHYATSTRIDIFPAERTAFAEEQLGRRRAIRVDPPGVTLYFYAPEDLIFRKGVALRRTFAAVPCRDPARATFRTPRTSRHCRSETPPPRRNHNTCSTFSSARCPNRETSQR